MASLRELRRNEEAVRARKRDDGIPACLKLTAAERRAGWAHFREKPLPGVKNGYREDNAPGSVARRLGFPENPADAQARADLAALEDREKALARAADEPRFEAMRQKAREDKEAREAIKQAVKKRKRGA
jgi:hypothetical protein